MDLHGLLLCKVSSSITNYCDSIMGKSVGLGLFYHDITLTIVAAYFLEPPGLCLRFIVCFFNKNVTSLT